MGFPQKHTVVVTTAAGGGATAFTSGPVRGTVQMITYTRSTGSPFASTVDFAITTEDTGQNLWTQANRNSTQTVYPLTEGDLNDGTESALVEVQMSAAFERLKIVIAQGGDTQSGTFVFVVG